MAFDPDKWLNDKPKEKNTGFDPDKYLGKKPEIKPDSSPSQLESAIGGATVGLTGGLSNDFGGLVDAALSKTGNLFLEDGQTNPYKDQTLGESYNQGRQGEMSRQKGLEQANPNTYLTGQLAGGVASPTNKLGLIGSSALAGAGMSEGDNVLDRAKDAGIGGAIGGAMGAAFKGAGKLGDAIADSGIGKAISESTPVQKSKAVVDSVKNWAANTNYGKAYKGGANVQKYIEPNVQTDLANEVGDALSNKMSASRQAQNQAREVFEQKFGKVPVNPQVGPGIDAASIAGGIDVATPNLQANITGKMTRPELQKLTEYQKALSENSNVNALYSIWDDVKGRVDYGDKSPNSPYFNQQLQRIQAEIKDQLHKLDPEGLKVADKLHSGVEGNIKHVSRGVNDTSNEAFLSTLGGRNKGNRAAATKELLSDNPELLQKIDEFQTFQNFNKTGGSGSNQGLHSMAGVLAGGGIGGIVGAAAGDKDNRSVSGIVGTLAGAAAASRTNQRAAFAKAGEVLPPIFEKIGQGIGATAQTVSNLAPQFQKALEAAATRGGNALAITHFILGNSNPEYQSQIKKDKE